MRPTEGHRALALCCGGALLLTAPGCSFIFVQGPPSASASEAQPTVPLVCTESRDQPTADTVIAVFGLAALAAGALLAANYDCGGDFICVVPPLARFSAIAGAAVAAIWGSSAMYGYTVTSKCRKELSALEQACASGGDSACARLPRPPATPPTASPEPPPG